MDNSAIKITPHILNLIAEIDEFKGSWKALKTLAPERLAVLKKIATIESIGSSTRIEGAKLSDRQIETLLTNIEQKSFVTRDEQEVAGYAEAMQILFDSWETIPLTENYLKQFHSILLKYSHKDQRHRGAYKSVDNHIEAFDENGKSLGVLFVAASPMMIPILMKELIQWTRDSLTEREWHPLIIISIFIVRFLAIHPFQDGNGRLSRVLTTLLLLKSGYIYVPFSSLETVIEDNKEGYYLALRRTQKSLEQPDPDWNPWIEFFLSSLKRQKDRLQTKVEREKIMSASLPELSVTILELIREQGRLSTKEIENYTQASRSTIKARLKELVEMQKISRNGKGRGTWYSLF